MANLSSRPRTTPIDETARPLRVLVVDDHARYRTVAAAVVAATDGLVVGGEAATPEEALSLLTSADGGPDVVLMDVHLGERSGIDLTRTVLAADPDLLVVLVSILEREELPPDAPTCGAIGFLQKARLSPASLRAALAGEYDWRP